MQVTAGHLYLAPGEKPTPEVWTQQGVNSGGGGEGVGEGVTFDSVNKDRSGIRPLGWVLSHWAAIVYQIIFSPGIGKCLPWTFEYFVVQSALYSIVNTGDL